MRTEHPVGFDVAFAERIEDRLAGAPVLRRVGPAQLADLAGRATVRAFEHGNVVLPEVCRESVRAVDDAVAVLAFGWCTAVRSRPDGSSSVVAVAQAGQIVGVERLTLSPGPPPGGLAAWVASGDVVAIRLPAANVRRAVESSGAALDELTRCLAERIARAEGLLSDRSLPPVDRLLRALIRLREDAVGLPWGRSSPFPLTQGELAALTGTTRETVNRSLQHLTRAGVVALREGRPLLLDRAVPARSTRERTRCRVRTFGTGADLSESIPTAAPEGG
jgi:CRP/FNR family transcriptional regulator, cyclic AMP receptor protein